MSISRVQIYNITLNILGISTPLENINIQDNKTILLNNYYEIAKDYVLKDFDWNFASVFRKLSLSTQTPDMTQFRYCYTYPNNCVCARDLFDSETYALQKFSVASLESGQKVILTDIEDAILRYTKKIDKEIYFSSEFTMALSYYLASLTANVLTGSIQKGESAYEKYRAILRHAKVLNAQEGTEEIQDNNTYLDSRS